MAETRPDDVEAMTTETPTDVAHRRGLITGLVVGIVGGAIVGGIIVGLMETRPAERPPVAREVEPAERLWGVPEAEFGPGRQEERSPELDLDEQLPERERTPTEPERLPGER